MNTKKERGKIDWMITLVPLAIVIALCVLFFFAPEQSNTVLSQIRFFFGDTSENAHRYEVSSRQRSMNGKDAKHYIAKLNSENYRVIFCHILMFIIMRK